MLNPSTKIFTRLKQHHKASKSKKTKDWRTNRYDNRNAHTTQHVQKQSAAFSLEKRACFIKKLI